MRRQVLWNDSTIHSYAYDEENHLLQIKYWETGKVVNYHGVLPAIYVLVFEESSAIGPEWEKYRKQFKFAAAEVKE